MGDAIALLNKPYKVAKEEFAHNKEHPIVGGRILFGILQSPYAS